MTSFDVKIIKKDGSVQYDFRSGETIEKVQSQLSEQLRRAQSGIRSFSHMADWAGFEVSGGAFDCKGVRHE